MSVPVVGLFLCPPGRERSDIDTCHYFVLFWCQERISTYSFDFLFFPKSPNPSLLPF